MEDLKIITEYLREELIKFYKDLKAKFDSIECIDEEDEYEDDYDDNSQNLSDEDLEKLADEFSDDNYYRYQREVEDKLLNKIKNSKFKKLIYFILLEDVYEYVKSEQILDGVLIDYEECYLDILEKESLEKLIDLFDNDIEFLLDIFSMFYDYNIYNTKDDKFKNRKLIELSGNLKYLEKFKVYKFDDIQYVYQKRKR